MTHMLYEVFLPETESCRDSAGRAWLRFTIKGEVLFVKKKKTAVGLVIHHPPHRLVHY